MSVVVVDASVLVKMFLQDDDSELARAALHRADELIAPELIVPETWTRYGSGVRQGRIEAAQARNAIPDMPAWLARMASLPELFPRAAALSLRLDHPIDDCFYLALAEREAAPLVTADERLLGLAGRLSVEVVALATAGRR